MVVTAHRNGQWELAHTEVPILFAVRQGGLVDQILGHRIKLPQEALHFSSLHRIDVHLRALSLGPELGVLHRLIERRAQRLLAILGDARRAEERTGDRLTGDDQPDDPPLLFARESSVTSGTSGKRSSLRSAICASRLTFLPAIQSAYWPSRVVADTPQMPSTSPRCIAKVISRVE